MSKYWIYSNTPVHGKSWREIDKHHTMDFKRAPTWAQDDIAPMLQQVVPEILSFDHCKDFYVPETAVRDLRLKTKALLETMLASFEEVPESAPNHTYIVLGKSIRLNLRSDLDSMKIRSMAQFLEVLDQSVGEGKKFYISIVDELPFK